MSPECSYLIQQGRGSRRPRVAGPRLARSGRLSVLVSDGVYRVGSGLEE